MTQPQTMAQKDQAMQDDFEASGSIYPKVTVEQINRLMERLEFDTHVVPGTTTTLATAYIRMGPVKFTIATDYTACVDPRNYDADKGAFYAIEKVKITARNQLWVLEGYALAKLYESKE